MKIICVVGARPNFIKIAPLMRSFSRLTSFETLLVHTGQHYDARLSDIFFAQLGIRAPDVELSVPPATQTAQTAEIMRRFEAVLEAEQPQGVLVVGDVNSTVACALAAAKFRLADPFAWSGGRRSRPVIIHVEAGLRSFDDDMPEEINRKVTDVLSDLLFVSEPQGLINLAREGVPEERMHFVGNVMIDTLLAARREALGSGMLEKLGLLGREYGLVTLHRPGNVDDPQTLKTLIETLDSVAARLPLVFPVHPRTRKRLEEAGLAFPKGRWTLMEPVGYLEFLALQSGARLVLTDSGGVQEETTALGVPCITLRENTERPCTVSQGTNRIAGTSRETILGAFDLALAEGAGKGGVRMPALWDGHAAERVVKVLSASFDATVGATVNGARRWIA
ncbi:MAG: UDP-N-acetylglucosamine 2-epimerase (non-hydrolyzing) [Vicinamibacteria bacterium]|nr:UDP-N-acetylglucosamine 2-epimerase (non-hydrolyzing) [Vicinamibacteria bacterium]